MYHFSSYRQSGSTARELSLWVSKNTTESASIDPKGKGHKIFSRFYEEELRMGAKIHEELLKQLQEAETVEPQREFPVIITIKAGTDLAELERKGLKIQRTFKNIPALS